MESLSDENRNEIEDLVKRNNELKAKLGAESRIEVDNLNKKMESLDTELQKYKRHYEQSHQIVLELSKENRNLKSQMKELSDANEEYEVDQLLEHKWQKGQQMFLVRWKGYGSEHDSWQRRENLSCDRILKAYLKQNKLN